ncbi:PH, RCC1 and FYVE domains-containing protein 1-like [Apium graveolens]|uniref:PH, RCC1 and FYVE domains-containing protein 1-like n=1 Tax=Apium graveolens TaxID=4045 RepID=UPI003D7AFAA7
MADLQKNSLVDRDVDQAFTALKRGASLLKYGRRGKPKFCPFRLSSDESKLIWYDDREEKQLELRHVSKIIPGQRTAIFQRYPRPEKEYQSFSLIYNDRSLDLICKDKDEAEVWFVALKALIARGSYRKVKSELRSEAGTESIASESPHGRRVSPSSAFFDQGDGQQTESRLGKAFSNIISITAATKSLPQAESVNYSPTSVQSGGQDNANGRTSASDTMRVSLSSAVSSSSQGSFHEDTDSLGDVYIWGEGTGNGVVGGGVLIYGKPSSSMMDAHLPKALESTMVLDAITIACGSRHAVLVTKQGEIFSWGEESGGRLGHGVEADVSHPKLIETLSGMNIEMVACGEYHTCAVTLSGDLYSWGDGNYNSGLLGHVSSTTHSIPKKVSGLLEGIRVSFVSCGTWHTALITSAGQLYTFGDGTFGALGHGDRNNIRIPREVETLRECRTIRVACGVWHTAAVVEVENKSSTSPPRDGSIPGKLFTWGDGDKGQLGHCDKAPRLAPEPVAALVDISFSKVACGNNLTVGVTTSGRLYTMGSTVYGQLGTPLADGKTPICIEGKIADCFVEEIACGSYHVAVLTSKTEIYTWGKGANGQLGHGDYIDRHTPTLVEFFKDKQVKGVVCGSNFTAAVCVHKWASCSDNSLCTGCRNPFNFRRKRHNCYNCGLVFCKACSVKKSLKASLAPSSNKSYRVCDDCYTKIQKSMDVGTPRVIPKIKSWNTLPKNSEFGEKETGGPRVQGQMSKLFSLNSFNLGEGRNPRNCMNNETDNRMTQLPNGNIEMRSLTCPKAPGSLSGASRSCISLSVPNSRIVSRAASPVKWKTVSPQIPSPTQSLPRFTSNMILDDPKQDNESLSQEVIYLKEQVEGLASKSKFLEAELERKSRELKEAAAFAADEAEKCKAAKEVIKSLTAQLKEMAERFPERHASSNKDSTSEMSKDTSSPVYESIKTKLSPPKSESIENSNHSSLPNGSKVQTQTTESVLQYEPGVYVTLSSLPGGGNELRRVRFSRKRFTEQQAEKWWAENGTRVCEEHNILTSD